MTTYTTRLTGHETIAEGTKAFHFAKPGHFVFKPGQAIDLILDDSSGIDKQSTRHAFSLVSAPLEEQITIATRMRDSWFKQTLKSLTVGSEVQIEGPFGSLTLHNKRERAAVFIAGGIGVTPFMSMLRQASHDRLPQQLVLLYSNRRPEDAAFLAELQTLERQNERFLLVPTMTQMSKSSLPWSGETGSLGKELIKRICSELEAPIYYLAGPPAMVEAMRENLNLAGVDDDDIRSEEFYGY